MLGGVRKWNRMFPSSSQIQTSCAPDSKYKAVFSWISRAVLDGERTSTQISGARVRHIKERTSCRRSGTTHATSGAFTPSEVETGQSVIVRPLGNKVLSRKTISLSRSPWAGAGGGLIRIWPWRSVSIWCGKRASSGSASTSAQRLRLNAVCSAESSSSIVKDISLILGQIQAWGNPRGSKETHCVAREQFP